MLVGLRSSLVGLILISVGLEPYQTYKKDAPGSSLQMPLFYLFYKYLLVIYLCYFLYTYYYTYLFYKLHESPQCPLWWQ